MGAGGGGLLEVDIDVDVGEGKGSLYMYIYLNVSQFIKSYESGDTTSSQLPYLLPSIDCCRLLQPDLRFWQCDTGVPDIQG